MRVLNDTADYYRFFDATPHAEFLYACVQRTIDQYLPRETEFLRRFDLFRARVQNIIEMPESTFDLLLRFLRQNNGRLSQRRRQNEFAQLTDEETAAVEAAYAATFGDQQYNVTCSGWPDAK